MPRAELDLTKQLDAIGVIWHAVDIGDDGVFGLRILTEPRFDKRLEVKTSLEALKKWIDRLQSDVRIGEFVLSDE